MWTTVGTEQVLSVAGLVVRVSTTKPEGGKYAWAMAIESGTGKQAKREVLASGTSRRLAAARERALLSLVAYITAPKEAPAQA